MTIVNAPRSADAAGERGPTSLRPIETHYAGRLFRSRLEARWAVFYNAIGIPWTYEPEGFSLADDLWYLPDFYLPQQACYVEIKPTAPTALEERKASLLAAATQTRVLIFFGLPGFHICGGYPSGQLALDGAYLYETYNGDQAGWVDSQYTWCVCPTCGRYGIEFNGRSERLPCHGDRSGKAYTYNDPRLLAAYDAANRARFERR